MRCLNYLLVSLYLWTCNSALAWSPLSSPKPDWKVGSASSTTTTSGNTRRGFFKQTTAAGGAAAVTAAVLTTTTVPVAPALAASLPDASTLVAPESLKEKVIVITGASTGLGLESAKVLAQGGATIVLTSRTASKGEKAVQEVLTFLQQQQLNNPNVYAVTLDLDDLDSVKTFPSRLDAVMKGRSIDVLMNNAGVMAIPDRQLTKNGYERTFQSNHLGHFVLTSQLLPRLSKDGTARVINVSSLAYQFAGGKLDLSNLNGESDYGPWKAYGLSKLENILFASELQRRSDQAGIPLTSVSLHPGAVNTDLARNFVGEEKWEQRKTTDPTNPWEGFLNKVIEGALLTPEQGASTQVFLAIAPVSKIQKGGFYSDMKPQKLPDFATDKVAAKELWERSEQFSGVTFDVR